MLKVQKMESLTNVNMELHGYKEESYTHRIVFSTPRSKFNKIKSSFSDMNTSVPRMIYTQFDFKDFRYGDLLPMVQDHFFCFYLPDCLEPSFILEENLTALSKPADSLHKTLKILNISLSFLDDDNLVVVNSSMLPYSYADRISDEVRMIQGKWACADQWTEVVTQIEITITVAKGWENGLIPAVQFISNSNPNYRKNSTVGLYNKFFLSENGSDIVIHCDDGVKLPAHKFVLLTIPVFAKMLQPQFKEGAENIVKIVAISTSVIKLLLEFLYCGTVNVKDLELDTMKELLAAAEKYMVDDLKIDCEYALSDNINVENLVEMYQFSEIYNAKNLKEVCKAKFKIMKKQIVTDYKIFEEISSSTPELMYSGCFE